MAILLFACRPADSGETSSILEKSQDGPIISGPGIVQDEFRIALLEKWKAIKPPLIEAQKLPSQTWMYGEGNPKNGLHATVAHRPKLDTSVTLPHRVLKPDWPLWYEREIRLKGSDWLYVDADDGAQVFQNGRLLTPTFGEFFSLLPGEEGSTEEASILTIRVLNNAMHGGLEDVRTVDGSAFQQYKKYREQRVQMQKILFEALHAVDLSASQKEAIKGMLEQIDLLPAFLARLDPRQA